MRNVLKLGLALSFATAGFLSSNAMASPPDHAARKAAAEKCGMPKRGEGKPTAEQEACMTTAGFPKPDGPPPEGGPGHHRGGRKGGNPPPPPEESPSTDTTETK